MGAHRSVTARVKRLPPLWRTWPSSSRSVRAESVRRAKAYLSGALGAMLDLGQGAGPMDHAFALPAPWSEEAEG